MIPFFFLEPFPFYGKILNPYAFLVELRKLKPTFLGACSMLTIIILSMVIVLELWA